MPFFSGRSYRDPTLIHIPIQRERIPVCFSMISGMPFSRFSFLYMEDVVI